MRNKKKKILQDYSAREWVKQGAPKEKLMIGMPTYGRSFTLVDKAKFDIGAPASGGGLSGNFTNEPGFLSYYEVGLIIPTMCKYETYPTIISLSLSLSE